MPPGIVHSLQSQAYRRAATGRRMRRRVASRADSCWRAAVANRPRRLCCLMRGRITSALVRVWSLPGWRVDVSLVCLSRAAWPRSCANPMPNLPKSCACRAGPRACVRVDFSSAWVLKGDRLSAIRPHGC
uniref:(northern house mosquito) hypothetical protein n=1 Tax=Culex pipiens TaxID=7175 RepID=A0A8D8KDC9_CULPI